MSPYDVFTSILSKPLTAQTIARCGVETVLAIADSTARKAIRPCEWCNDVFHTSYLVENICESCWTAYLKEIAPSLLMAF